jgi:hypothetical protein
LNLWHVTIREINKKWEQDYLFQNDRVTSDSDWQHKRCPREEYQEVMRQSDGCRHWGGNGRRWSERFFSRVGLVQTDLGGRLLDTTMIDPGSCGLNKHLKTPANRPASRETGLEMPCCPASDLLWVQISQCYPNRRRFSSLPCPQSPCHTVIDPVFKERFFRR